MCKEHQKEAIKTRCPKLVQESQYRRCFSIRFFRGSSIKTAISNRPWPTLIMRHVDVHLGSVGHASQLHAWTKKENVLEISTQFLEWGNFLNDFFLCSSIVIYMTHFLEQITFSMMIYSFHRFYPTWTNFWCTNIISAGKKLYLNHQARLSSA